MPVPSCVAERPGEPPALHPLGNEPLVKRGYAFHTRPVADRGGEGQEAAKGRAWCEDRRHVLLFHRQMAAGWPESPHVEGDESALSGRTDTVTGPATVYLGLPLLTPDRTKVYEADVLGVEPALAWPREVAGAG